MMLGHHTNYDYTHTHTHTTTMAATNRRTEATTVEKSKFTAAYVSILVWCGPRTTAWEALPCKETLV